MTSPELSAELNKVISEFLSANGYELVDLIFRLEGRDQVLRLLTDRLEGGITMDECASLNQRIGQLLDEKGVINSRYILEVASPGLDRNLVTKKDFLRCLNKQVVFFLNALINGKYQWQGIVMKVEEPSVFIDICAGSQSSPTGQILEIPLASINKARLVI